MLRLPQYPAIFDIIAPVKVRVLIQTLNERIEDADRRAAQLDSLLLQTRVARDAQSLVRLWIFHSLGWLVVSSRSRL